MIESRVVLRPIANPLPLGFLALAAATLLVSGLQLGWLAASESDNLALILIAFVFPLQLTTSVFGFLSRDAVAGTGMGILAGTWLSVGLVTLNGTPGSTSDALGLFLLIAGCAMLVPAIAAGARNPLAAVVMSTVAARFALTGIYQLSGSHAWEDAAGVVGLALCALAVFAALALGLEAAAEPTVREQLDRG